MHFSSGSYIIGYFLLSSVLVSSTCISNRDSNQVLIITTKNKQPPVAHIDNHPAKINTGKITPAELTKFATSLKGIPYKYGSVDPNEGFDCSGFITYVFNHFGISVPRSSYDFTFVDHEVKLAEAKTGDLILFTGTDNKIRNVGHMGIILTRNGEDVNFIHATSGKAYGVTETSLNPNYTSRFLKVIRVFPSN